MFYILFRPGVLLYNIIITATVLYISTVTSSNSYYFFVCILVFLIVSCVVFLKTKTQKKKTLSCVVLWLWYNIYLVLCGGGETPSTL